MGSFLSVARVLFISLLVSAAVANKTCQKPRVRREWRKFTLHERAEWIRAVNCLAALPHDPKLAPSVPTNVSLIPPVNKTSSFYDDIVYIHMDLNLKIHTTGFFFPWHRYYIQYFEDSLIERCGYKGTAPYWDWTQDALDFYNTNVWDNSSSGVGAWGDPADDYQIFTGGFKDMVVAYPSPHRIRRNFTLFPFINPSFNPFAGDPAAPPLPADLMINTTMTKENVDHSVNNFEGDFIGLQGYTEGLPGSHPGLHLIVDGELSGRCPRNAVPPDCYPGPTWSPNDPIFFMHHAMIDKIWYDWQNKSPRNKYAFAGGSITPLPSFVNLTIFPNGLPPYLNLNSEVPGDGLWSNVTVWDTIDTRGGKLCFIYV